jgi:hypothetical protein
MGNQINKKRLGTILEGTTKDKIKVNGFKYINK